MSWRDEENRLRDGFVDVMGGRLLGP